MTPVEVVTGVALAAIGLDVLAKVTRNVLVDLL
jgi:hypothetical protein